MTHRAAWLEEEFPLKSPILALDEDEDLEEDDWEDDDDWDDEDEEDDEDDWDDDDDDEWEGADQGPRRGRLLWD